LAGVADFLSLVWDEEILQLMLLACPDGVVVANPAGKIILYTGASERIFGFQPVEVLGKDLEILFDDEEGVVALLERLHRDGQVVDLELPGARKDGQPFYAAVSSCLCRDRYGAEIGIVLYVRDHTNLRSIEAALRDNNRRLNELVSELHHVARHDQLTGLLNRGSAVEAAQAAILARGYGSPFGVAVLDLDYFKTVNDTHGHLVGDDVLAALARVLQAAARAGDIVGRFGGEEFVAFLPGADLAAVTGFAERVRAAIEGAEIAIGDGLTIRATISAGVASIPSCAGNLQEALRVADDRLYLAKRGGRNRVVTSDATPERNAA
jgi:diguanylate cyclase (GGDEF)-like protein/PAS domain S-box-containing protein